MKKIIIVGAGPAGLGAALYFADNTNFDVTVIDQGKDANLRRRCEGIHGCICDCCNDIFGLGGAGGLAMENLIYTIKKEDI